MYVNVLSLVLKREVDVIEHIRSIRTNTFPIRTYTFPIGRGELIPFKGACINRFELEEEMRD